MAVTGIGPLNIDDELSLKALLKNKEALLGLNLAQVQELTFRMRELNNVSYSQEIQKLDPQSAQKLAEDFNVSATRAIAEWSLSQPEYKDTENTKKLASVYHRAPHGAEMRKDAELFLQQTNLKSLFEQPEHQLLFSKMAEAAHAMHDVIQALGPVKNEVQSYLVFVRHCENIFKEAFNKGLIDKAQKDRLKSATKMFGWEVIVVGTIFDFPSKKPLVDILNKKSIEEASPKQLDAAIACATFAAGKNDTRRMDVILKNYLADPALLDLIKRQMDATRGSENVFMQHMNGKHSEEELIAFRHLIGQNCRMICELKTHFGKEEDVQFADFFSGLILNASTTFDDLQWGKLKSDFEQLDDTKLATYFDKLMSSFEGDFGEIAFARGLNSDNFQEAITHFNKLYPKNTFNLSENGKLWSTYAESLAKFIKETRAGLVNAADKRSYMIQVFTDLALYGGHQAGHALLRADEALSSEYEVVVERARKIAQSKFNSPIPNQLERLRKFIAFQRIPSCMLEKQIPTKEQKSTKAPKPGLRKMPAHRQLKVPTIAAPSAATSSASSVSPSDILHPNVLILSDLSFSRGFKDVPREEKIHALEQLVRALEDKERLEEQKANESKAQQRKSPDQSRPGK